MLTAFESKDLNLKDLYVMSTPKKSSFFHAICNATFAPYRTGKVETDDGMVAVNPDTVVAKLQEELCSGLTLPIASVGKSLYELLEFKETPDQLRLQIKSGNLNFQLIDYIALTLHVQLEIVDFDTGKIKHVTPISFTKITDYPSAKCRIILVEEKFAYSLVSQKPNNQKLTTNFKCYQ